MPAQFIDTPGTKPIAKVARIAAEVEAWALKRGVNITVFYGSTTWPDHSNRRCLDVMTWNAKRTDTGKRLTAAESVSFGNALAEYFWTHRARLGLNWIIWQRRIKAYQNTNRGTGSWRRYTGPNPHVDHVHVEVASGAYKAPSIVAAVKTYATPTTRVIYLDKALPGVTGSDSIYWIQTALKTVVDAKLEVTGSYDKATVAAAMAYQKSLGDSEVDGELGPLQISALLKAANMTVALEADSK